MPKLTNQQFHAALRNLESASAGRLAAVRLRQSYQRVPTGTLHQEPAQLLADAIAGLGDQDRVITADTPLFVVSCDGTPIVWVSHHLRLVTPAADLTPFQHRNQDEVAATLADIHRSAIAALADARDAREGRPSVPPEQPHAADAPWVRVAAADDPTYGWWTPVTTDPRTTMVAIHALTGTARVRIIDVLGCGDYANGIGPVDLAVLCAMHRAARQHLLPTSVIGDWVGEADPTGPPGVDTLVERFAAVYQGRFDNRYAFADHVMVQRGWTAAMAEVGMPDRYLHRSILVADLFSSSGYRDINVAGGGIAVVKR